MRLVPARLGVLFATLCVLVLARFAIAAPAPELTIVGGAPVPDPNPYRYQVAIGTYDAAAGIWSSYCGGSLIAPAWVLSAAHCFVDELGKPIPASSVQVAIGVRDLLFVAPEDVRDAAYLILHPAYDPISAANDLALIALSVPVTDPGLLVPLSTSDRDAVLTTAGTTAIVTGWGSLVGYAPGEASEPLFPSVLHAVALPLVDQAVCAVVYPELAETQLCAGFAAGGSDACQGDSGGPLVVSDNAGGIVQVGIVSYGNGCAAPDNYGVYTRVSAYTPWITATLNPIPLEPAVFVPLLGR